MPRVCIERDVLGERFDICIDSGKLSRCDGIPSGSWTLGVPSSLMSLEILSTLSNIPIRKIPGRFTRAFKTLNHVDPVRWQFALPSGEFDAFMHGMLEDIKILLERGCVAYYTEVFRRTRECLGALGRACIDAGRLERYIAHEPNESNRSVLQSFRPLDDGLAPRVTYNQTSTVTGRLIVESGPRILTLSKRYRDMIVSRYEGGRVLSLDFSSLEPRIILIAQGREAPRDIYAEVCETIFGGMLTRLQAKAVTISLLYGASESTIQHASGLSGAELKKAIEGITAFFGLEHLLQRLIEEAQHTGGIKNYFGRPLVIGDRRKLINLYAQSSAVDAALLGFANGIDEIKDKQLKIIPIFSIHDALVLDVHPDHEGYIDGIVKRCGQVSEIKEVFPVRCEEISNV